jgi:hypothetical protein
MDKSQLVITALQQRIGEVVSNYETQIAFLRAEITTLVQEQQDKVAAVTEYNQELLDQMEAIPISEVMHAKVGHVISSLRESGRQHTLVI